MVTGIGARTSTSRPSLEGQGGPGCPRAPADIWAILGTVLDPEVPVVSVTDLGIVRDVRRDADGGLTVTVTPTYSGCPANGAIALDIEAALLAAGEARVRIEQRLAPPWTTDWMSAAGREKLRAYGIAPPQGSARAPQLGRLLGEAVAVPCPRCGSAATALVSQFGSTACKAHWRCKACLEPFDYFKCI